MNKHFLVGAMMLGVTACGGGEPASKVTKPGGSSAEVTPAAREEATKLFASLCVTCHGTSGHGDGPGAAQMDPKPRSFADPAWQASVDDAHIIKVITLGGAAVGKSPMMPPQPQLKGKHGVLRAMVDQIRAFRAD